MVHCTDLNSLYFYFCFWFVPSHVFLIPPLKPKESHRKRLEKDLQRQQQSPYCPYTPRLAPTRTERQKTDDWLLLSGDKKALTVTQANCTESVIMLTPHDPTSQGGHTLTLSHSGHTAVMFSSWWDATKGCQTDREVMRQQGRGDTFTHKG